MKSSIRLAITIIALVGMTASAVWAEEPSEGQSPAPAEKTLKVLSIGNSFSNSLSRYFKPVVESVPGCHLEWDQIYIGGCSMERHWSNIDREANDPSWRFFKTWSYKDKVQSKPWDVVSIQQASHFSWQPETYFPYAKNLYDFIKENAPTAEIVIQETWAYRPDDGRLNQWGITQDQMYEKLKAAYTEAAQKLGVRLIPVGDAVQLARQTQPGGYKPFKRAELVYPDLPDMNGFLCGNLRWEDKNGKKTVNGDASHLNARGEYLQACVWFAFLFDRDANDVTYVPKGITESDAKFLRSVAQKAVEAVKASE